MSRLASLTPTTAVGASKDLLAELVNRHGQVGDMVAAMAHSPLCWAAICNSAEQ